MANVKRWQTRGFVFALTMALATSQRAVLSMDDRPPLPSLRHLVFDLSLEMRDAYEVGALPARSLVRGSLLEQRGVAPKKTQEDARAFRGRIVCDVVAATADGGLVVDIGEETEGRQAAIVRVAIESNGRLHYPPQKTVFEEEIELLRLLARGIVGPQPHAVGSNWSIDDALQNYESKTTFRVSGSNGSSQVDLDAERKSRSTGGANATGSMAGKIAYDQRTLVPRGAKLLLVTNRQTLDGPHVIRMTIELALLADSFAPR